MKCRHKKTGNLLAAKIYDKFKLIDENRKKSLKAEIRIMRKLKHNRVCRLYEVMDTSRHIYLIMELVEGLSLNDKIKTRPEKRFTENEAAYIFKQLCEATDYMHSKNVIHRDIKMENIMLDQANKIKIIDFGFSVNQGVGKKLKTMCGTPTYMSPEIIKHDYDGRASDVWALGVVLFFMLNGSQTDRELFKKICRGGYAHKPGVSSAASKVIKRMFER